MSAQQWESFRKVVNHELEPLNRLQKCLFYAQFATIGVFPIMLIGMVTGFPAGGLAVLVFIPFACVGLTFYFRKQVRRKLRAVCGRISQEGNGMTFHACNEYHETKNHMVMKGESYIEVRFDRGAAGGPVGAPTNLVVVATVVDSSAAQDNSAQGPDSV